MAYSFLIDSGSYISQGKSFFWDFTVSLENKGLFISKAATIRKVMRKPRMYLDSQKAK